MSSQSSSLYKPKAGDQRISDLLRSIDLLFTITAFQPRAMRPKAVWNVFVQNPSLTVRRRTLIPHTCSMNNPVRGAWSCMLLKMIKPVSVSALTVLADDDSRFLSVDGISIHYKVWGTGRPLLLCVHGFGASLFSFELAMPALLKLGRVAAIDAVGFGLTARPPLWRLFKYSPSFTAKLCLHFPIALQDQSRPSPNVIIAHSLGSLGALEAATKEPENISALVLVAPPIFVQTRKHSASRAAKVFFAYVFLLISILLSPILRLLLRFLVTSVRFWERGLSLARAGSAKAPQEVIRGYRQPLQVPSWDSGILNFCRSIILYRSKKDYRTVADLAAIAARLPVLIIHGADDRLVPVANSRALVREAPLANLVVIPSTGHVPHEERPADFAAVVDSFLSATRPSS